MTDEQAQIEFKQLMEDVKSGKKVVLDAKETKDNLLKNIMIGYDTAHQVILDHINRGDSLEDIKKYVELNLSKEGKKAMKNVFKKGDKK